MRLFDQAPSQMIDYSIPATTYHHELLQAMMFSSAMTMIFMMSVIGLVAILYRR